MIKLAFFDVDGTLSLPIYHDGDKEVLGFTDENWFAYLAAHGEDTYEYCLPLPRVRKYAEALKANGASLCVLTTTSGEAEDQAKKKFIERCYGGLFEAYYSVLTDTEKVPTVLAVAREAGCLPEECELVEDTYRILLTAHTSGIKATHLSSFLAEP